MIDLAFRDSHLWARCGNTLVRGEAFDGNQRLTSAELATLFAATGSRSDFLLLVERLNGFFAVVQSIEDECRIAVDRIRSIPLFYTTGTDFVCVSDDCHWVASRLPDSEYSDISNAEFRHLGYVTDTDTRITNIKQCLPGEAVFFDGGESMVCSIERHRYFRYAHRQPVCNDSRELAVVHRRTLERVFRRLIEFSDGRTIVIPLSGGYDSRLCALMLHKCGYDNVVAFSYGREGNWESQISRRIARDLGFP